MNIGYRVGQGKDHKGSPLKQNYNSTMNIKNSFTTQRLQEIRKKYDTPTRKQFKQSNSTARALTQKTNTIHQNIQFKKFIKPTNTAQLNNHDKWTYSQNRPKDAEMHSPSTYLKQNMKSQEQIVFKKIKQMKDSLLTKNHNERPKINSINYSKINGQDLLLNQHRDQNVQKINSKIQQILNYIRQTENKSSLAIEKDSKLSTVDYLQSKKNAKPTTHPECPASKQQRCQGKIIKLSTFNQQKKPAQQVTPTSKIVQRNDHNGSKIKSFTNSIQKSNYKATKYEMKSGKKLDDEIKKIQSKIQHFEQQKKKLNIDFKPYSYSQSKSSNNLRKRNYTITKFDKQHLQNDQSDHQKKIQQIKTNTNKDKIQQRLNLDPSTQKSSTPSSNPKQATPKPLQSIQVSTSKVTQHSQQINEQKNELKKGQQKQKKSASSSRVSDKITSQQIKRKTDQGILQRKKKITKDSLTKEKPTLKKLVQKISQQAKLDQLFRNNKIWFESDFSTNKWQKLQKQFQQKNLTLTTPQIKSLFTITDEQNNPFFSARQTTGNTSQLITSYFECQQYWSTNISKNFSQPDLSKDEFNLNLLDLQKKGFIVLEDLVRFMNMETGTFYRNRDFYLIFKRISQNDKIQFNTLIDSLCKTTTEQ